LCQPQTSSSYFLWFDLETMLYALDQHGHLYVRWRLVWCRFISCKLKKMILLVSFRFDNDFVKCWVDINYRMENLLDRLQFVSIQIDLWKWFYWFRFLKWLCLLWIGNNECWIDCMYLCYHSVEHDFHLLQIGINIWLLLAWAICFVLI